MEKIKVPEQEETLPPEVKEIWIETPVVPLEMKPDIDFFPHAEDGQMAKYQKPAKPKIRR